MWAVIAVLALVFALASASLSTVVFLGLSRKLELKDVSKALEQSSAEQSANYARSIRAIQTEWEDIYQKFTRLTGRVEKAKGLDSSAKETTTPVEAAPMRRADILKKYREVHQ